MTAENWRALAESNSQKVSQLKLEVEGLNSSLSAFREKTAQLNSVKKMLTIFDNNHVDLEAVQTLKLIHVIAASVPNKNFEALKAGLVQFPLILSHSILTKENSFVTIAAWQTRSRCRKNR